MQIVCICMSACYLYLVLKNDTCFNIISLFRISIYKKFCGDIKREKERDYLFIIKSRDLNLINLVKIWRITKEQQARLVELCS